MSSLLAGLSSGLAASSGGRAGGSKPVRLTPTPGFVVKSLTSEAGFYLFPAEGDSGGSQLGGGSSKNVLEPASLPKRLSIPRGQKVFLNIAWDPLVPAPPETDEATIRRAMAGADLDDEVGEGTYYVPVVVSEPREDKDKAGKASLVFDCVFSLKLKSRCTKDAEFRMYILELALEHVETKANMQLSRQIGTPNISSKGKLEPRTVMIPTSFDDLRDGSTSSTSKKLLVEELPPSSASTSGDTLTTGKQKAVVPETDVKPKSILKKSAPPPSNGATASTDAKSHTKPTTPLIQELRSDDSHRRSDRPDVPVDKNLPPPRWKWANDGDQIKIEIEVPKLTHALHADSILDVEPRRLLLHIPRTAYLDIDLEQSDEQIGRIKSEKISDVDRPTFLMSADGMQVRGRNAGEALRLKRARDLDVDNARAQWLVEKGMIVVWA